MGGFYILRAKGLKAVRVHAAFKQNGEELTGNTAQKLCELLPKLPKNNLIDMNIVIKNELTRVIAYWSKKEKQYTFLVTNLPAKRFITGCVEKIFKVEISTITVSKTTGIWWLKILMAIMQKRRKGLLNAVNEAFDFLRKNTTRAHPKRARKTGIFQYGLTPNF